MLFKWLFLFSINIIITTERPTLLINNPISNGFTYSYILSKKSISKELVKSAITILNLEVDPMDNSLMTSYAFFSFLATKHMLTFCLANIWQYAFPIPSVDPVTKAQQFKPYLD